MINIFQGGTMVRQFIVGLAAAALLVSASGQSGLSAENGTALSGSVSSPQEGKMEGVVVTARGEGANFAVSVVSDSKGRYSFPRTHLPAGKYTVKIRAVGYDLSSPNAVEVASGKTATLDLTLDKAKDISTQLTSVEWLNTIPGTDEQKAMVQKQIESCTYCHSVERIVKSRHTADEFVNVIHRMLEYYPDGTVASTEGRGRAQFHDKAGREAARKNPSWGVAPGVLKADLAAYLASINRSGGRELPTDFKTLPRPKGKATRVIITAWDLPRRDTVSHDSDVDSKGNVWYTDQSRYFFGRLDPKTGTFKEWPLPEAKTHEFGGGSDVQVGKDDMIWFPVTTDRARSDFGQPVRFDPKTEQFTQVEGLNENEGAQFMTINHADGSIIAGGIKIDGKTAKVVDRFSYAGAKNAPPGRHYSYEPSVDSKGNWYGMDFGGSYVIKIDAQTKEVSWLKTPTAFSEPRRGKMDLQDRLWFAEYTGDNIAMLDTKTGKFQEWSTGKWTGPYTASMPNKAGQVFAPSGASDRVYRLDPKTGEVIGYLMPTLNFDAKQVSIDPVGGKAALMSNERNAQIIRVEPLD
jgi:streptogramin lyase